MNAVLLVSDIVEVSTFAAPVVSAVADVSVMAAAGLSVVLESSPDIVDSVIVEAAWASAVIMLPETIASVATAIITAAPVELPITLAASVIADAAADDCDATESSEAYDVSAAPDNAVTRLFIASMMPDDSLWLVRTVAVVLPLSPDSRVSVIMLNVPVAPISHSDRAVDSVTDAVDAAVLACPCSASKDSIWFAIALDITAIIEAEIGVPSV